MEFSSPMEFLGDIGHRTPSVGRYHPPHVAMPHRSSGKTDLPPVHQPGTSEHYMYMSKNIILLAVTVDDDG